MATADDRTRMAHTTPRRRRLPSDEAHDRLADVLGDVRRSFFLGGASNFTNHDETNGVVVCCEHLDDIKEARADDWVSPNTYGCTLT